MSAPLATQNFSFKCNLVSRKTVSPAVSPRSLAFKHGDGFHFYIYFSPRFAPHALTHNRGAPFHPFPHS